MSSNAIPNFVETGTTTVAYECTSVVAINTLPSKYLYYTYEMLFDCSGSGGADKMMSEQDGIVTIETTLLNSAKMEFMNENQACFKPQSPWFASIDTAPADVPVSRICSNFNDYYREYSNPENLCCSVVDGAMTFMELSQLEMDGQAELIDWLHDQFALSGENKAREWPGGYLTRFSGASITNESPTVSPTQSPLFTSASPTPVPSSSPTLSPQLPPASPTQSPSISPTHSPNTLTTTPTFSTPTISPTQGPTTGPTTGRGSETTFSGVRSDNDVPSLNSDEDSRFSPVGFSFLILLIVGLCCICGIIFKKYQGNQPDHHRAKTQSIPGIESGIGEIGPNYGVVEVEEMSCDEENCHDRYEIPYNRRLPKQGYPEYTMVAEKNVAATYETDGMCCFDRTVW